jgi:hypothetical protein
MDRQLENLSQSVGSMMGRRRFMRRVAQAALGVTTALVIPIRSASASCGIWCPNSCNFPCGGIPSGNQTVCYNQCDGTHFSYCAKYPRPVCPTGFCYSTAC